MLWIKALHIIAMVAWFAGLFYLPRLFVYHVDARDTISIDRFKLMEWRLYYAIAWPAALLTSVLGIMLVAFNPAYYLHAGWMHAKFMGVLMLWGYHLGCGHYRQQLALGNHHRTSRFYRFYNEIPTVLLLVIVLLVVLKP